MCFEKCSLSGQVCIKEMTELVDELVGRLEEQNGGAALSCEVDAALVGVRHLKYFDLDVAYLCRCNQGLITTLSSHFIHGSVFVGFYDLCSDFPRRA